MWLFAAWVGLVGGVGLLHDAPLYAVCFLALGLAGLTKTVLGAGRFLRTVPAIVAREREARAAAPRQARSRPAPPRPARLESPPDVARRRAAPARRTTAPQARDQQRAAA
jgi:hypothetical protein